MTRADIPGEGCGRYAEGDVPGIDRPWQYGDTYMWGEVAMRVTDPQMMNLGPIACPPSSFVLIEDAGSPDRRDT